METVKFLLSGYVVLITTWWWLVLGAATFFGSIVFVLKEDDCTLTTWKAIKLSFVGVGNLVPFINKLLPTVVVIDFMTRWIMASVGCSFRHFVLIFLFLSFFFAPVFFLLIFGTRFWDNFTNSELGAELMRYGIGATIKMRLRG